jgi:hypothetical protein
VEPLLSQIDGEKPHNMFSSARYGHFLLLGIFLALSAAALAISTSVARPVSSTGLADTTVLIIRHAEKPDSGTGLAPAGEARAQAYVGYFQHLRLNGVVFRPDTLIATADSKNSARERLTLEPLSKRSDSCWICDSATRTSPVLFMR